MEAKKENSENKNQGEEKKEVQKSESNLKKIT